MGVLWNFFAWIKSNAGSITAICAFFATIFVFRILVFRILGSDPMPLT